MKRLLPVLILSLCTLMPCNVSAQPVRKQPMLVSFNGLTDYGRRNRDSVFGALSRFGITGYDTVDRNTYGSTILDYTPWCVLLWSSGDPMVPVVAGEATGQSGLSAKEIGEVERFLQSGRTYQKKSFIIAGQNIAYEHGYLMPNGISIDTEFLQSYLHTKFVANSPVSSAYKGTITGRLLDYNSFPDNISSASPDVVKPALVTPTVGPEVNWWAYSYNSHSQSPVDSGAGTTYRNPLYDIVFYGFDWADPVQTTPGEIGTLSSGVTRILRGGIDFFASHGQGYFCPLLSVEGVSPLLPFEMTLTTASPTISSSVEIRFSLPIRAALSLRLLDVTGKTVRTEWTNEPFFAGEFTRTFDLAQISSGVYFYQLEAVDERRRMVTLWKKMGIEK